MERYRYELNEYGEIRIYFGKRYITTCADFKEVYEFHTRELHA